MKKILAILLALTTVLSSLLLLASCGGDGGEEATTPKENASEETTTGENEPEVKDLGGYTATKKENAGVTEIDRSLYDFIGTGEALVNKIKTSYGAYTPSYTYSSDGETYNAVNESKVSTVQCLYATLKTDTSKKTIAVTATKVLPEADLQYENYEAVEGTFIRIPFLANAPADFTVNIGRQDSTSGLNKQEHVSISLGEGGYGGKAAFSVPFVTKDTDYYINVVVGERVLSSTPIHVKKSSTPLGLHLIMTGDWDLLSDDYAHMMQNVFYESYPRLYKRWAQNGNEPIEVTLVADKNYDGVAYTSGKKIVFATDYAKKNPTLGGYFSHELTHSTQQYKSTGNKWWTENFANYGRFRYFEWLLPDQVKFYEASTMKDWGYSEYGNCQWFFAWMDYNWPTTKDANGKLVYGLIDTIHYAIKNKEAKRDDVPTITDGDTPTLASNGMNTIVKRMTGYDTIDALRLEFGRQLDAGEWTFNGFADYPDNFLIEDIEGMENPAYPQVKTYTPTASSHAVLPELVTSGLNLALQAKVTASGQTKDSEAASLMVDGKDTTKWCSTSSTNKDKTAVLSGIKQTITVDLGSEMEFNTYTFYLAGHKEKVDYNARSWEILVSSDNKTWTAVDYQTANAFSELSVKFDTVTARYVKINFLEPDNGAGTARVYEFMLYNK